MATTKGAKGIDSDEVETLVDRYGLRAVIDSLANICWAKSEHISTNWQDRQLAGYWSQAGRILDSVSASDPMVAVDPD